VVIYLCFPCFDCGARESPHQEASCDFDCDTFFLMINGNGCLDLKEFQKEICINGFQEKNSEHLPVTPYQVLDFQAKVTSLLNVSCIKIILCLCLRECFIQFFKVVLTDCYDKN
jgi:hypothetical protein